MDTSAGESEFDIFVGLFGTIDTSKTFAVGIPYSSAGCGRVSQHISFADKVNMNSVGVLLEYGIRAIQTYTDYDNVTNPNIVITNGITSMSKRQYRIPYLVYITGTVATQSGSGVEGVTISYCHISRVTGQRDTNLNHCPLATFVTDKLGQWSGQIQVSDIAWKNTIENFYVDAFYNQTLQNNRYVVHTFQPASQKTSITHLDTSMVQITDTTTITIFGSVQFDPTIMGGSYNCPFSDVPVIMVQGNGQVINTTSDANGDFIFSVTQSDAVSIYIPDFNGNTWRSTMSVAASTDLSSSATVYSYTDTATSAAVHDFIYSAVSDDGGHWIKVHEKNNNVVTIDQGRNVINGVFQQYGTGNVRISFNGFTYNFYQRLTYKSLFDFYSNFMVAFGIKKNVFNIDYLVYSSYSDLTSGTNFWLSCNQTIGHSGYPGNCGYGNKINIAKSSIRSSEIWIQVFPQAQPNSPDVIVNGDFETAGTSFNKYAAPVGWQISLHNNISTIQTQIGSSPTLNGSPLAGESGSLCGISHVLINKPAGKPFGGIYQVVNVPIGKSINQILINGNAKIILLIYFEIYRSSVTGGSSCEKH